MSSCCIAYNKRTGQILLAHFGLQNRGWEEIVRRDALGTVSDATEVDVMRVDGETLHKDKLYKVDPVTRRVVESGRGEPGFSCFAVANRRPRT